MSKKEWPADSVEQWPIDKLAPFGVDTLGARQTIAAAARATGYEPDEVWCAAGSGVLIRSLKLAWPEAEFHAVQVGRALSTKDVAGAKIHIAREPFSKATKAESPFPSDPHYDAKAWAICKTHAMANAGRNILFWNVTGPADMECAA